MTYKGYTIEVEVPNWARKALDDEGNITELIEYVEDPNANTTWYVIKDSEGDGIDSRRSFADAKQFIDELSKAA